MKTLKYSLIFLSIIFFQTSFAQEKDYTKEPGYVEFGDMSSFDSGENVTEVFIEKNLLNMVGNLTKDEDPVLSELLNGLVLVKVNSYSVTEKNASSIRAKINDIEKKLSSRNWQRIVRSRNDGEFANVYIKTAGSSKIVGLVVTASDEDGEAAFVNIVGDIDLDAIGKLSKKFGIPSLDSIKNN